MSKCIIILGMHRSGTSATTRVINLLGAKLSNKIVNADPTFNKLGFWESPDIINLNEDLMNQIDTYWHDVLELPDNWFHSKNINQFVNRGEDIINSEFGDASLFTLKDPRICRLLPFWLKIFKNTGIEPHFLIPIRNPLEVAASLTKRNGFLEEKGLLLWLRYMLDAERGSRGYKRTIIKFDDLLSDWKKVIISVSNDLNINWPVSINKVESEIDNFLSFDEKHHIINNVELKANSNFPEYLYDVYHTLSENTCLNTSLLDKVKQSIGLKNKFYANIIRKNEKELFQIKSTLNEAITERIIINYGNSDSEYIYAKYHSNEWVDLKFEVPSIKKGSTLRIDPCTQKGIVTIKTLELRVKNTGEILFSKSKDDNWSDIRLEGTVKLIDYHNELKCLSSGSNQQIVLPVEYVPTKTILKLSIKFISSTDKLFEEIEKVATKNYRLIEKNALIETIYNSYSWKITKPLRWATARVNTFFNSKPYKQ